MPANNRFFLVLMLASFSKTFEEARYINTSANHSATPGEVFPWSSYRLPDSIIPEHYYITIHPDFQNRTFTGRVKILLAVLKDTDHVVLNSKNLQVREALLLPLPEHHNQKQLSLRLQESVQNEQVAFTSSSTLQAGRKYELFVSYTAALSSSFSGFYKTFYRTRNGTTRMLAATHFEATSARKAFPCFDEPSMKAVFSITIIRDQQHYAISNMPKRTTVPRADGLLEDHFLHSVKMSSYLVAFVVSDFASKSTASKRGTKVSVFAPSEQMVQTQYALHAGVKILQFFEEYFQIPYPLPKIDLVAIPDFETGAMENWGLITFRETSLLYDPKISTLRNKLWVTEVIAHELAHQWFGNLVTMEWWNDLWLNEGFATYMEFVATNHLEPSLCAEDQLLITTFYRALEKDSFRTSHPISLPVRSSAQIREMFDVVSYCKGASILRMLHNLLTEPIFTGGIRAYLKEHSYGNAHQDHLWQALTKSAVEAGESVNVKAIMDTWTMQKGYPLVSVTLQGRKLKLSQSIFTLYPQSDTGFLWQIPFTFYTSNSTAVISHLMKSKEESIDLPHDVAWIKANVNSTGFYRVSYDLPTLRVISHQLREQHSAFSRSDRASLIDDTFHLASQGTLKYSEAFSLSLSLGKEKEYLPIRMFVAHMTRMLSKFAFSRERCVMQLLKKHILSLLGGLMQAQRWDDSGTLPQQNLRTLVLSIAKGYRRLPAAQHAERLFHHWMEADGKTHLLLGCCNRLPRTLRGMVFQVGIKKGGDREWTFLLHKYIESTSSTDKVQILAALSRTRSTRKKKWLLNAALQNQVIKTQDFGTIVRQLARSPKSNQLVWMFVQRHWSKLVKKFSLGSSYLSRIVVSITSKYTTRKKYEEVKKFFRSRKNLRNLAFVRQSLEMIKVNILWLKKNKKQIKSWLRKEYTETYTTNRHCRPALALKRGRALYVKTRKS
ncbi:endoplasmic reticulum aminopeptidase 1-like isoform X1 [Acipenser ruthenus]|uniref:endoplasmic reticulum aminopeptidase 1-like isoform X1 n=1 Tax=Acipenser ruthenus TaxID=7906 RepID=UPI002741A436|nr:endoplasmic reticulum aminopeptidase 1-like isoform X1 [Acipenser ruthenus]